MNSKFKNGNLEAKNSKDLNTQMPEEGALPKTPTAREIMSRERSKSEALDLNPCMNHPKRLTI